MRLTDRWTPSGAWMSPNGTRRFLLWRAWPCPSDDIVSFVMLNPSDADEKKDDPTIRKCIGFSKSWGYGRLFVANLDPLIGSKPAELSLFTDDAYARFNTEVLVNVLKDSDVCVAAWGAHPEATDAGRRIVALAETLGVSQRLRCLGTNLDGSPKHPGRIAYATPLVRYPLEESAAG